MIKTCSMKVVFFLNIITLPSTIASFMLGSKQKYHQPQFYGGFQQHENLFINKGSNQYLVVQKLDQRFQSTQQLNAQRVSIQTISPEEASKLGCRDWPQQEKRGSWEESTNEGQSIVRYVLDGTGTIQIKEYNEQEEKGKSSIKIQKKEIGPGTLIEIDGSARLLWATNSNTSRMIILTPSFEQTGVFVSAFVGMIVLFGFLIAGVGS